MDTFLFVCGCATKEIELYEYVSIVVRLLTSHSEALICTVKFMDIFE